MVNSHISDEIVSDDLDAFSSREKDHSDEMITKDIVHDQDNALSILPIEKPNGSLDQGGKKGLMKLTTKNIGEVSNDPSPIEESKQGADQGCVNESQLENETELRNMTKSENDVCEEEAETLPCELVHNDKVTDLNSGKIKECVAEHIPSEGVPSKDTPEEDTPWRYNNMMDDILLSRSGEIVDRPEEQWI